MKNLPSIHPTKTQIWTLTGTCPYPNFDIGKDYNYSSEANQNWAFNSSWFMLNEVWPTTNINTLLVSYHVLNY